MKMATGPKLVMILNHGLMVSGLWARLKSTMRKNLVSFLINRISSKSLP